MTVARVYANANADKPRAYWDYESFHPTWKSVPQHDYVFDENHEVFFSATKTSTKSFRRLVGESTVKYLKG